MPKFNLPDARGYVGIASFILCVMVIWIMKEDRSIREDEFFQTIATIIIANGWMSVVAWGYAATKGGGELADKNADIVDRVANHKTTEPQDVNVTNPKPIKVKETK